MKERKQPETLRLRSVTPALTANDLEASLAWYRDRLGFLVGEEHRHQGALMAVTLRAGAVEVLLSQDDFAKGRERKKGEGLRLYCQTAQDVDRLAAAIKARGGTLAREPADQPWGARAFALEDPDGFKITIAAPRG